MYPEDRVIVGVVRRKQDLQALLEGHWYRIPLVQMPDGMFTDYLAFFLSANLVRNTGKGGAVCYYAPVRGVELALRRELLPREAEHPRAEARYYHCQLGDIQCLGRAITNPNKRRFAFIYTTFDRLMAAQTVADLYSEEAYFVRRIYYALPTRSLNKSLYKEHSTFS